MKAGKEYLAEYEKIYNAYYSHSLPYNEYSAKAKALFEEITQELCKTYSPEELRTKFFKDYGCMNGWGAKTSFLFRIASILHADDMVRFPELHCVSSKDTYSCYHVTHCKCGFHHECDSGD